MLLATERTFAGRCYYTISEPNNRVDICKTWAAGQLIGGGPVGERENRFFRLICTLSTKWVLRFYGGKGASCHISAFLVSSYLCAVSRREIVPGETLYSIAGNLAHWLGVTLMAANRLALLVLAQFRFVAELGARAIARFRGSI